MFFWGADEFYEISRPFERLQTHSRFHQHPDWLNDFIILVFGIRNNKMGKNANHMQNPYRCRESPTFNALSHLLHLVKVEMLGAARRQGYGLDSLGVLLELYRISMNKRYGLLQPLNFTWKPYVYI